MSKRIETEVPEDVVETKTVTENISEVPVEKVVDTIKPEKVEKTIEKVTPSKGVELMAVAKKIGVVRYLQDHPKEPYIETLMKKKYAMQAKSIPEWDEVAIKIASIKY